MNNLPAQMKEFELLHMIYFCSFSLAYHGVAWKSDVMYFIAPTRI